MKRFQKIVAMALAATLAVPGSALSTFASARVEEAGSFFTSFEDGEEWSDRFKANTLETVDGVGKTENVSSTTADRLVGNVVRFVDLDSVQGSKDFNNNEAKVKLFDNNSSTKSPDKPGCIRRQPGVGIVPAKRAKGDQSVFGRLCERRGRARSSGLDVLRLQRRLDLDGIGQPKRDRV